MILRAGPARGHGLVVYILHDNDDVTVYGHMEKILVEAGQTVRAGDTIALLGNRGRSTGAHLHFEVLEGGPDGRQVDPARWLRERGVDIQAGSSAELPSPPGPPPPLDSRTCRRARPTTPPRSRQAAPTDAAWGERSG